MYNIKKYIFFQETKNDLPTNTENARLGYSKPINCKKPKMTYLPIPKMLGWDTANQLIVRNQK